MLFGCAPTTTNYYIKTSVSPDSNIKVAVINENADSWWVSSIAYRTLITELMDVGFKVIERTNLEQIIKEQKLTTSSGLSNDEEDETTKEYISSVLDKNTIKEIGNMLGVDKLIVTYVVPNRNLKMSLCTIRFVDVFSGEVLTSTTIYAPLKGSSIDLLMKQAANDIMEAYKNGEGIVRDELSIDSNSNAVQSDGGETMEENKFRKTIDNQD